MVNIRKQLFNLFLLIAVLLLGNLQGYGNQYCSPFVLYTSPKSGTYLLTPILAKMTARSQKWATNELSDYTYITNHNEYLKMILSKKIVPLNRSLAVTVKEYENMLKRCENKNAFITCHTPYSKNLENLLVKRNTVVFHILRDPRDYVVSGAFFYGSGNQCIFPIKWFQTLPFNEQLKYMITGTTWNNSTRWFYDMFTGWVMSPIACLVFYEKLLGPYGGVASCEEQIAELRKIATSINLTFTDQELVDIFQECYGKGPTYKDGSVGKWKKYFSEEHKDLCKRSFGDLLIKYGFENDYDW